MIQYRFDCGSGPGLVRVDSIYLNDGNWHSVLVERRSNRAEILVDGKYKAESSAPGVNDLLNVDGYVYFGAEVTQRLNTKADIRNGFEGMSCMSNVLFYSGIFQKLFISFSQLVGIV